MIENVQTDHTSRFSLSCERNSVGAIRTVDWAATLPPLAESLPRPPAIRPWRAGSEFGPGPRRRLSGAEHAWIKSALKAMRRVRTLTPAQLECATALLGFLGHDGQCAPSFATLAARADCSPTTAKETVRRLEAAGVLRHVRRLARDKASGWQCRQISNAYEWRVPPLPAPLPAACEARMRPAESPIYKFRNDIPVSRQDRDGRENARRQLAALGAPIPRHLQG